MGTSGNNPLKKERLSNVLYMTKVLIEETSSNGLILSLRVKNRYVADV
jgi:hypothetical protein